LKDDGGGELALRYDLTVPLARGVAMNPTLKMPFKRYQIDKVFRDGPIEKGRVREFYQCDADVIGIAQMSADTELIAIAQDVFKELKLNVIIKINNRKILDAMIDAVGITQNKNDILLTLDKLYKIERAGVEKELAEKGISAAAIKQLLDMVTMKGTNEAKIKKLKDQLKNNEGLQELECLYKGAAAMGIKPFFDPSLARGLAYYTATIFEVVLLDKQMGSVGGGGRYDNLIGSLVGSGKYPAVGISFGLDRMYDVIVEDRKFPTTTTQVYVIPVAREDREESVRIAQELRAAGINTDMDLASKSVTKNLEYANKLGIPYVMVLGENERKKKKFKLKDMQSGKEQELKKEEIIKFLKKGNPISIPP
ncbi:MAG: histidine--tRNA ligase, partial [Nanoarchaeota archaeon]